MSPSVSQTLGRPALAIAALLLGLLAAKVLLRVSGVELLPGFEHDYWRDNPDYARLYQADSVLGFRPRLGTPLYGQFGTLRNDYPPDNRHHTYRARI